MTNPGKILPLSRRTRFALTGFLANLVLVSGLAAESTSIGVFRDWTALTFGEPGATACMMWSQPREVGDAVAERGETLVFVTHRPGVPRFDSVTFDSGFPLKVASTVEVTIEGQAFVLSTDDTSAWTRNGNEDKQLVEAMRAGLTMVVESVSQADHRARDTYSLRGFSAAHDAINAACGAQ